MLIWQAVISNIVRVQNSKLNPHRPEPGTKVLFFLLAFVSLWLKTYFHKIHKIKN